MAGRKPKSAAVGRSDFAALLADVKGRIQTAQTRAVLAVNAELVRLYWDIGQMIDGRQRREGWGAAVIPRLAKELKNELPELKGFSERNIDRMIAFYRAYPDPAAFSPPAVAKLLPQGKAPQVVAKSSTRIVQGVPAQTPDSLPWSVPWAHHVVLMEKVKDLAVRRWYMAQTLANGWSRNVLAVQIDARAHARHGKAVSNFAALLPAPQSDLAQQALKDPYIFDFLTLTEPFQERELETELVRHLEKFLLELDHAVRQIISRAVSPEGVVDIFAAAGLAKPDISILSDEFLSEVRGMPQRNLAVELLQKLLKGELRTRRRKNLVQARSFAELLEQSLRRYQNRAIEAAQVIEELIGLAKQMREADLRGEAMGLSDDELAFYDALETNDSAVKVIGDDALRAIARELVASVRANVTIDWTVRENVRAQLRVLVKRILRKHGYPPDKQEQATQTVLEQAAVLSAEWASAA